MKKPIKHDRKKFIIILLAAAIIIAAHLITKLLINHFLELGKSIPIIKSILHITLVHNQGAAFGILQGFSSALVWISVIVIGLIIYFYDRIPRKKSVMVYVALILGGTISNLADRLRLAYIIDFVDFRVWPAFNIADIALTVGVIGLIIYLIKKK